MKLITFTSMRINLFAFLTLLFYGSFCAQESRKIFGNLNVEGTPAANVYVLNLNTEQSVMSDSRGEFVITMSEEDLLVISSVSVESMRKSLTLKEWNEQKFNISLRKTSNELTEVEINVDKRINAKDLGIIMYTPKKYTPAEAKLRAAKFTKQELLGVLLGQIKIDPILYWITGETARLKQGLEIENNLVLLNYIDEKVTTSYCKEVLNIPEESEYLFKYYVLEDPQLRNWIEQNESDDKILLRIVELSQKFHSFIYEE